MRLEVIGKALHLTLSRRNLLTLLTKLDLPGSARTIFKDGVYITAEEDKPHYGTNPPGPMHPITEAAIIAAKEQQ